MFNRYSQQYQPAMFNPLSFEDYAAVPLLAQQKHDQYVSDLTAQKDAIQGLTWHDEAGKKAIDELNSQIENATSGLINSKKGIYGVNTAQQLGEIRNYKEKSFNPLKQEIEGAAKARQELKERYQKLVDAGKYDESYADEALALFDNNSINAFKKGDINYDGRILAYDADVNKKVIEAAKSKPMQEFIKDSGWQVDPVRGAWINTKTNVESNGTPKELVNFAKQFLIGDTEAMNYFRDKTLIETSLYATEKDEMGNILYNNKAYNPEKLTSTLFNDKIENAAEIASNYAVRNTSQTQDMRNLSDWQLDRFGFNDKVLSDMRTTYGGSMSFDSKNVLTPFEVKKKIIKPDGSTITGDELKSTITTKLKELGYEQFIGENGQVSDIFFNDYLRRTSGNFKERTINKTSSILDQIGVAFSDLVRIGGSLAGSPLAMMTLSDPTLFETYGGAQEELEDFFTREGYKKEDLDKEEQSNYQKQFESNYFTYKENTEKILKDSDIDFQLPESTKEGVEKYNRAVRNNAEREISMWESFDKDNPFLINEPRIQTAVATNNPSGIIALGEALVFDKNGKKLIQGKKVFDQIESETTDIIAMGQTFKNNPEGFTGGYMLGIKTSDGSTYRVLVPPSSEEVKRQFLNLDKFNSFSSQPTGLKTKITEEPIFPVEYNNGAIKFHNVQKIDGFDKNGTYFEYYQPLDDNNQPLIDDDKDSKTYKKPYLLEKDEIIDAYVSLIRN